ncbi:MAG: iron-containing alcohol dehydrogenase [Luminiphilus sp.]|nr:iron-containing alcohol dehydrogenase [Luminiphilus sp.]
MNIPEAKSLGGVFTLLPMDDVFYGENCIAQLEEVLGRMDAEKALLITGNTLRNKTDLVERVMSASGGRIAEVFFETQQHVPRSSVVKCLEIARATGVDAIISFGGGSPNDTAKAVVMGLAENVESETDFDHLKIKFEYPDKVEVPSLDGSKALPLIAIPTTLSAGEYTHFIGVTDEARKVKDLYIDKCLTATAVFLDPNLTLETPEWLWLSSGMRSVDHCVEAICSTTAHPYTDALACHALQMLNRYLRECKTDPSNTRARLQCQLASWLSVNGLANVTLGLSHGTGHQLGARCNVPHGITSCVMMHNTMRFNKNFALDRLAWIAQILEVKNSRMSDNQAADAAADAVQRLTEDLGLPYRLRDVGVEKSDFRALAEDALQDLIVATNPRPVTSPEVVIELFEQAY